MTRDEVKAAGLDNRDLSVLLEIHESNVSKMLSGRTSRSTPGAKAIVWMYARLSPTERAEWLAFMRGHAKS